MSLFIWSFAQSYLVRPVLLFAGIVLINAVLSQHFIMSLHIAYSDRHRTIIRHNYSQGRSALTYWYMHSDMFGFRQQAVLIAFHHKNSYHIAIGHTISSLGSRTTITTTITKIDYSYVISILMPVQASLQFFLNINAFIFCLRFVVWSYNKVDLMQWVWKFPI